MRTELAYQKGTSDKVYNIEICSTVSGKFVVNFEYGKRGTNLKTGTKTPTPVTSFTAQDIHDDLMNAKLAKGYYLVKQTSGIQSSAPNQTTVPTSPIRRAVSRNTGLVVPSIPNRITSSAITEMLDNPLIGLQIIPNKNQVLVEWHNQNLQIYSLDDFAIDEKFETFLTELFFFHNLGNTVLRGFVENNNLFLVDALFIDGKDIQTANTVNRFLMLRTFATRFNLVIATMHIDQENKHFLFNAKENTGQFLLRQLNQPFDSHNVGEWFANRI